MAFDLGLLETLLYQPEGPALDFKQEQYLFEGANTGNKAELLKDILAFANAWRLTTAYILIGVSEVKGSRSKIDGVHEHLDDANLHQFVNGKTQRPVEFTYLSFRVEGVEIGVLEIPLQDRPIFLTRRFGHLDENKVFIRDGSSTRVAKPDEIAKMGAEQVLGAVPQFDLQLADLDKQVLLPSPYTVHSLILEPQLPAQTFSRPRPRMLGTDLFYNQDYSREVIACTAERALLTGLGFRLQNNSGVVGKRIRFIGRIPKSGGTVIQEWIEEVPSPDSGILSPHIPELALRSHDDPDLTVREYDGLWEIDIDFGDVRPRDEVWTVGSLFVGSTNSGFARLAGELKGDNLPNPVKCELDIKFKVNRRPMDVEDVRPYLSQ